MANAQVSRDLSFSDNTLAAVLYGELNKNLQLIEQNIGVSLNARGNDIHISGLGHEVALAADLLEQFYALLTKGFKLYSSDFAFGLRVLEASPNADLAKIFLDKVYVTAENRIISPKTRNQKIYIDAMRQNDVVFGIGPAGTGKTYLAVAMAVSALSSGQVRSIILTNLPLKLVKSSVFCQGIWHKRSTRISALFMMLSVIC
jgi:phosphate starvation-inducible PhoH-like protein